MLKPKAAKYISAVIASILTSAPVATVSYGQTRAAEECISSPKGTAPEGSHWYYRVDRATKRHCWYLGELGGKVSRVRAPSHRVAQSIAPEPEPTQRLVADAHAELPARASIEQPNGGGRPNWPLQADAANASAAPLANEAGAVIASRWPDGSSVSSAARSGRRPGCQRTTGRGCGSAAHHGRDAGGRGRSPGRVEFDADAVSRDRVRTGARRYRRKPRP